MARAYIGTSGWNYKHWANGVFYPNELRPQDWLKFFAERFNTVEINNSFYRLPSEAAFQNWRIQVPQDFLFAVKANRFITHLKRLKDPAAPLDLFYSRAVHLRDRLGPVLFQLPPRFKMNLERLETFLSALKAHTGRRKLRCALEVRDASWLTDPVFEMLRKRRVALCFADWRDLHVTEPVTTDFVYVRRHYGSGEGGNYPKNDLDRDAEQIARWMTAGLDAYLYFNNDQGGHAFRNAAYVAAAVNAPRSTATAGSDKRRRAAGSTRRRDSSKPL